MGLLDEFVSPRFLFLSCGLSLLAPRTNLCACTRGSGGSALKCRARQGESDRVLARAYRRELVDYARTLSAVLEQKVRSKARLFEAGGPLTHRSNLPFLLVAPSPP